MRISGAVTSGTIGCPGQRYTKLCLRYLIDVPKLSQRYARHIPKDIDLTFVNMVFIDDIRQEKMKKMKNINIFSR